MGDPEARVDIQIDTTRTCASLLHIRPTKHVLEGMYAQLDIDPDGNPLPIEDLQSPYSYNCSQCNQEHNNIKCFQDHLKLFCHKMAPNELPVKFIGAASKSAKFNASNPMDQPRVTQPTLPKLPAGIMQALSVSKNKFLNKYTTFSLDVEPLLQPEILNKLIKINKTTLLKSRFLCTEFLILRTIPY